MKMHLNDFVKENRLQIEDLVMGIYKTTIDKTKSFKDLEKEIKFSKKLLQGHFNLYKNAKVRLLQNEKDIEVLKGIL